MSKIGVVKVGFSLRTLVLACRWLPSRCVLKWSFLCDESHSHFLFLSGHQSDWIGDYIVQWPHFNLMPSLKAQFPNSEILEVKASISEFWGSTILNSTF